MKQAAFEALHAPDWERFAQRLEGKASKQDVEREDFPRLYRRLCQHLALARERQYSPELVDRLNALALRGHHTLYGARGLRRNQLAEFFLRRFPRLVREESPLVTLAALLFFGPLALIGVAVQFAPDFIYYLLGPAQISGIEEMYNPANERPGMRAADSNVVMFAFYIWNNVKIGFQTFAGGLLFGLGSIFYLLFNGVHIGAVIGHLTHIGYGTPIWSFVAGHSAFELTGIVLSGAAGLRLGLALISPGRLSRAAALTAAAKPAIGLVYGAATLFTLAAFVEAFWSPITLVPPLVKYAVGGALIAGVLLYFVLAGRPRAS